MARANLKGFALAQTTGTHMPYPSPPLTFSCRTCSWKKTTTHQVSDVRLPGLDHFEQCPRCRGEVETHRASLPEVMMAKMDKAFGKIG